MTPYEVPTLKNALTTLAETFNRRPPTQGVVADVWFLHLEPYPLQDVLDVLHEWPRDHESYPSVAAVRRIVVDRRARFAFAKGERAVAAEPPQRGPHWRAFQAMWADVARDPGQLRTWCEVQADPTAGAPAEHRAFAAAALETMGPALSPAEARRRQQVRQQARANGMLAVADVKPRPETEAEREAREERAAIVAEGL